MMEGLLQPQPAHKAQANHKDKLAETKKQEAAVHEALKKQQHEAKEAKEQKRHGEAHAHKAIRELNLEADPEGKHSKRAVKEQRELLKHAEKAATGTECEHGVQRCRICFPPRAEVAKHHEHERAPPLGAPKEVVEEEE